MIGSNQPALIITIQSTVSQQYNWCIGRLSVSRLLNAVRWAQWQFIWLAICVALAILSPCFFCDFLLSAALARGRHFCVFQFAGGLMPAITHICYTRVIIFYTFLTTVALARQRNQHLLSISAHLTPQITRTLRKSNRERPKTVELSHAV